MPSHSDNECFDVSLRIARSMNDPEHTTSDRPGRVEEHDDANGRGHVIRDAPLDLDDRREHRERDHDR